MKGVIIFAAVLLITFSFGCASKDRVYENLYQGLQTMERMKHTEEPPPPEEDPMDYQEYKKERENLLKDKAH